TRLLPCNREPERTHDVSGRCPLSSRDHGEAVSNNGRQALPLLVRPRFQPGNQTGPGSRGYRPVERSNFSKNEEKIEKEKTSRRRKNKRRQPSYVLTPG